MPIAVAGSRYIEHLTIRYEEDEPVSHGIRPDHCSNYEAPTFPESPGRNPAGKQYLYGPPPQQWLRLPFTPRVPMAQLPAGFQCEVEVAAHVERLLVRLHQHPVLHPFPRAMMLDLLLPRDTHHYLAVRVGLILRCRVSYCENTDAYHFHYNDGFHPDVEVLL